MVKEITCKDCWSYGELHSSCDKVRNLDVSSKSLACKDIKICKATIEALKELKAELEYANTINEDISINSLTNTPDIVSCEEQGPVKKLILNNK